MRAFMSSDPGEHEYEYLYTDDTAPEVALREARAILQVSEPRQPGHSLTLREGAPVPYVDARSLGRCYPLTTPTGFAGATMRGALADALVRILPVLAELESEAR